MWWRWVVHARALFFVAPRRVEIRPVEVPPLEAGDVLVRTLYSGISSGTEVLAYRGQIDPRVPLDERIGALGGTFEFPFSYGYSCVGRVERSEAALPVGSTVFAFHPHQDLFGVRASAVIPLSGGSFRNATLFPAVETALQISLDAGDVGAGPVLVLGLGTIGLLTALMLARAGADVLGADPKPWRRAVAASAGIDGRAPEDVPEEIRRRTSGEGVPLAVEASGRPEVLGDSLRLLRHEGTVLVASWYGTRPVALPLGEEFHRRRLTIRSTQVSTIPERLAAEWTYERRRKVALDLVQDLPLEALATHEFAFEDAPAAFAALDRGDEGIVHAALRYGD
jgi:2-desacetyl-2-hydroxyethyl bacteriochlorophyllide A dehydrogenase